MYRRQVIKNTVILLALLLATPCLLHCGKIKWGGTTIPNDPAPTGNIVAQGEFTGLNGNTMNGTAEIYLNTSGRFIIRLVGITVPNESGLQVIGKADGREVYTSQLRFFNGSQNYSTNITSGQVTTWDSVMIRSAIKVVTPEIAQALLR